MRPAPVLLLLGMLGGTVGPAGAAPAIQPEEWRSYVEAFIGPEGRVIDTGNGGISHSEGQGYGLVLSVLADDRPTFERLWSFTATELMVREDGLAAWRWEPDSQPHVTDTNNATDGDMLIAYGLLLAGGAWDEPAYAEAAAPMIRTIGRTLLVTADGLPVILPGAEGFAGTEADARPVLNPSYWVYEVFPAFARLDPVIDWAGVGAAGLEILLRARATPSGLPADWVQLEEGGLVPARDFAPEFGYNGIRIPLYLMRAGIDAAHLEPFRASAGDGALAKVDVVSGEAIEPIGEPGYRLIAAAMDCLAGDGPVPGELRTLAVTSYYAATLQLLLLDHLRRHAPECLDGGAGP